MTCWQPEQGWAFVGGGLFVVSIRVCRFVPHMQVQTHSGHNYILTTAMVAFISFNSSWIPLIEGLYSANPWEFDLSAKKTQEHEQIIDAHWAAATKHLQCVAADMSCGR